MTETLRALMLAAGNLAARRLNDTVTELRLDEVAAGSFIDAPRDRLRDRSVLLATHRQLPTALALIELDGQARRLLVVPAGLPPDHLRAIAATANIDVVLCDDPHRDNSLPGFEAYAIASSPVGAAADAHWADRPTAWLLPTSGTSGPPKLVAHTLRSLIGAVAGDALGRGAVWSTFYDIRRFGGLQIFLRAMVGGGSMVLSDAAEPVATFLSRAGDAGVTHVSGTPSHWRRALMAAADADFAPRYVRLSGEVADQAIIDRLRAAFPVAAVSHAFASTEAGVAFDVGDGLAGFPTALVGGNDGVVLRVKDGSLRIRSPRTASDYVGEAAPPLRDADGFVDTGDMVELIGDRYHFVGRRSGIINVGGLKVHPERVEAVIAGHDRVRMCLVKARGNPVIGAVVVADVVADAGAPPSADEAREIVAGIMARCRDALARHEAPVSIRFVAALDVAPSGKVRR